MHEATILIVDDLPENIELIKNFFIKEPYKFLAARTGSEAIEQVHKHKPDLVLLDVIMPGMDGFETCTHLKNDRNTMLTPVVMVTGLDDRDSKLRGIEAGVDDFISKPINIFELKARVASLLRIKRYTDQLEYAERIIFSLALAVEAKDPYTNGHCNRLANYGALLAERLGLPQKDIDNIRRGGILHDIGKLAIQDDILLKPASLTKDEYKIIKTHPEEGERICKPLKTLENVLPIIRSHQERFNGSGYPDGLVGEHIPLQARIIAMVDSFDALTTNRPYRDAFNKDEAISILETELSEGKWDGEIYREFKHIVNEKGIDIKVNQEVLEISPLH